MNEPNKEPMEQQGLTPATQASTPEKNNRLIVHDTSEVSHLMDSARFEQAQRVATTLASAALTPKHLKGSSPQESIANCFRVVNQAFRWGMDPFAVADETYVVSGRLGYQGKLVASVINTRSNLAARLRYEYEGQGDGRTVTVIGRFANEDVERTVTLSVAQAKTSNDMWKKDPDQKLYYSAVIKWARRHCPEVILGVMTEDDVQSIVDRTSEFQPVQSLRLPRPQFLLVSAELKAGKINMEDIEREYPTLIAEQMDELRGLAGGVKLETAEAE